MPLWVTLSVCAAILGARRPDVLQHPQFWAEDGAVFFLQAWTLGASALVEPYAGYLHTILRIIAWLASGIDPALAPAFYIAAAAGLTLYVAARTQSSRFPLPPSIGYALAVVLVPDAFEILLNLTNLQWVLAGGLVLLLIAREPVRLRQRVHDIVAVTLLGLTGPFIVLLLPLFVWRALQRRTRFSGLLAGIAAVVALMQLGLILRFSINGTDAPVVYRMLLAIPGARIGGSLLSGGHWRADLGVGWTTLLGVITLAGVAALALRRGPAAPERRLLGAAFAGLLAIVLYRCRYVLPEIFLGAGSRYFFPLQMIVLWLSLATVLTVKGRAAVVGWTALSLSLVLNLPRLREPAFKDFNWPEYAGRIRRGERVNVPSNPDWHFVVPGRSEASESDDNSDAVNEGLVNLSMRCEVKPGRPAVVGFALRVKTARTFLVRAVGPSLTRFSVSAPLLRPRLTLLKNGMEDAGFRPTLDGMDDPAIAEAAKRCQAFELESGRADQCGLVVLSSGLYSVVVEGEGGTGGEVLVELYEVPPPAAR